MAELIVTISIMAIAVVTIVSAMAAGILVSSRHREQSKAGTVLVSAAEWVKAHGYDTSCSATRYNSPPQVSGYPASVTVKDLDDSGAEVTCSNTTNLQRVTITVTTPTHYSTNVAVVKRNNA